MDDDQSAQKAFAKAFYRRAKVGEWKEPRSLSLALSATNHVGWICQARLIPIISSYNDDEDYKLALQDLKSAALVEPNDPVIRKELAAVRETLRKRRRQDDAAFKKALPSRLAVHDEDGDEDLHGELSCFLKWTVY